MKDGCRHFTGISSLTGFAWQFLLTALFFSASAIAETTVYSNSFTGPNFPSELQVIAGSWTIETTPTQGVGLVGTVADGAPSNFAMAVLPSPAVSENYFVQARIAFRQDGTYFSTSCWLTAGGPCIHGAVPYVLFNFQDAANYKWLRLENDVPTKTVFCRFGEAKAGIWSENPSRFACMQYSGSFANPLSNPVLSLFPTTSVGTLLANPKHLSLRVNRNRVDVFVNNELKGGFTFSSMTSSRGVGFLLHNPGGHALIDYLNVLSQP